MNQRRRRTWGLDTTTDRATGMVILAVTGRIGSANSASFADALEAARRESLRIVVDLEGVDYMSGPGLSALQEADARTAEAGGTMILCNLCDPVRIAIDLAGLGDRLAIADSREAALGRLR